MGAPHFSLKACFHISISSKAWECFLSSLPPMWIPFLLCQMTFSYEYPHKFTRSKCSLKPSNRLLFIFVYLFWLSTIVLATTSSRLATPTYQSSSPIHYVWTPLNTYILNAIMGLSLSWLCSPINHVSNYSAFKWFKYCQVAAVGVLYCVASVINFSTQKKEKL